MTKNSTDITLEHRHEALLHHYSVELELLAEGETPRHEVERFIQVIFNRAYRARITHFLPYLLSMREEGRVAAALGMRPAKETELFLENYLDRPVENVLAEKVGRPIDRTRLVEVGNLASGHGGGARALIVTLTAYLKGAGYEWVVFTATPRVRNNFAKLGIALEALSPADPHRLGEARHDWGNYYDQAPVVVAGDIAAGAATLRRALNAKQLFPTAEQLWHDAFQAGRCGRLWQPPRKLAARLPVWMREDEAQDEGFKL